MKKSFSNTRVSVKMRKSPYSESWFLFIEAFPVFDCNAAILEVDRDDFFQQVSDGDPHTGPPSYGVKFTCCHCFLGDSSFYPFDRLPRQREKHP